MASTPLATLTENDPRCYHCGLDVPAGTRHTVVIGGESRRLCCAGCEAVARAIVGAGLEGYYRRRDRFPASPREALPEVMRDLSVYDRPEIQDGLVQQPGEHDREATLILEGMTCPACIWLNEAHLSRLTGVVAASVNYATRRARVRWDSRRTSLSTILSAIQAIGYRAYPYDPETSEAARRREARSLLGRLAIAGLGMMQVMMYAIPTYLAQEGTLPADIDLLMRWASLALTVPVVGYSSVPFFRSAWRELRVLRFGMDLPVALAIGVAFSASVWATLAGRGPIYFDSLTMFVFLLLGARYLELRARQRASMQLEAMSRAAPTLANRLLNFPLCLNTETVRAASLARGEHVLVRPGETFPVDGVIEQGETEADESLLTGESAPVAKREGDPVIGGAVNRGDAVVARVERVGDDSVLSSIVRLMERAVHSRPHLQQITDRVAARFTAVLLLIAIAAGLFWFVRDAAMALPIVIAVLVVTCPCALALATPLALAVANSEMARRGLLVTRSHAIESLAGATCFVFDKTGTFTAGRPVLREVGVLRGTREEALALAAALENVSEHPLAHSLRDECIGPPQATDLHNFAGHGVEGVVSGRRLRIGHADFVAALCQGKIRGALGGVWLGDRDGPIARFEFSDALRPDAAALTHRLRGAGAKLVLLSGDGEGPVRATAQTLGIDEWKSAASPADKQAYVKALQERGERVAMVGDGVNDAPVLAQADVSIAMGSGAALAQGAADMVLLSGKLIDLAEGVHYARRTLRIIRQNLGWAVGYNLAAIPLAVAGYVTPWLAGIGMAASSTLVVLNALRLTRARRERRMVAIGD
jgi:Cu2+-exporting ATPase